MYGYSRSKLRDGDVGPIRSGKPPYTDANTKKIIVDSIKSKKRSS